jgi:hypothetical protein
MKTIEFRNHLCKMLDQRIKELSDSLASGLARDHGAYLNFVGQIAGLRAAREMLPDALRKTLGEDAEEEMTD